MDPTLSQSREVDDPGDGPGRGSEIPGDCTGEGPGGRVGGSPGGRGSDVNDENGAGDPSGQAPGETGDPAAFPVGDRELLDWAVASVVTQNRAHAERLEALSRFHENRVAEVKARAGSVDPGFFLLTPVQATRAEFAPLLAMGEPLVAADLDLVDGLKKWFPRLWERCLSGRLDLGRARLAYAQLENLTCTADKKAYAAAVQAWLESADDPGAPICPVGWRRFRTAVRRRCLKFPQRDEQDSFAAAFSKRRVTLRTDEAGMATLTAVSAVPDLMAADYRLTLIAKKLAETEADAAGGETGAERRTLAQLRVDALVDLIHGRLRVGATTGELEDDTTADGADPATTITHQASVGAYARPVINVTVPITTLMGAGDEPGVLAGDVEVPADLARQLALHPESTWYRLLTDPAGRFLELSVDAYAPTAPLCRHVTARDRCCVWPECARPASVCEIDHRVSYPHGPTATSNLQPLCRRHHLVKHSHGFQVTRGADGTYTWTSRFGSTFTTPAPDYPASQPASTRVAVPGPDPAADPAADAAADLPGADVGSVIEHEFRTWMMQQPTMR